MQELEAPPREAIAPLCDTSKECYGGFAYNDRIWVKYGVYVKLEEAEMQRYMYDHVDPQIVRIPKVLDAFAVPERNITCIVTEKVDGESYKTLKRRDPEAANEMLDSVAKAVRHIWDIPPPPNVTVGPIGNRMPTDRFFSDCSSGQVFHSLAEIQDWINGKLEETARPDPIDLQGMPLAICHCDLTEYNIKAGAVASGPVAILNWDFSGIYPTVFEEFALFNQYNQVGAKFAKALHERLFGEKLSKHMRPMSVAARYHAWGYP